MRKCYLSKKSFTCEIYDGTSKAAGKVFQQRGASSIREASSIRRITANKVLWYFNAKCSIQ